MGSLIEMIGNIVSEEDDPGQPAPRDVGRETRDTLQARIDLAPQMRLVDEQDAISGAQRNLLAQKEFLFGFNRPGQTVKKSNTTPGRYAYYDQQGVEVTDPGRIQYLSSQPQYYNGRGGVWSAPAIRQVFVPGETTTTEETLPGEFQKGFIDIYEQDLMPRLAAIAESERAKKLEQDIALAVRFGPEYIAAMRASNPEQFALRDRLMADAGNELSLGDQLDPFEQRTLQQSIRQGQTARGFGYGSGDAAAEGYYVTAGAKNRRNERREFARSMIGLDQALIGNPFTSITGRDTGNAPGAILSSAQSNSLAGRRDPFDPMNSYASDVYGSNFNAGWGNYADVRNRNRSLNDAMWSNAGETFNSILSMGAGVGSRRLG